MRTRRRANSHGGAPCRNTEAVRDAPWRRSLGGFANTDHEVMAVDGRNQEDAPTISSNDLAVGRCQKHLEPQITEASDPLLVYPPGFQPWETIGEWQ